MNNFKSTAVGLSLLAVFSTQVLALERLTVSGYVAAEGRLFLQDSLYQNNAPEQSGSISFQPEIYLGWSDDRHSLNFVPFLRVGDADDERNHIDIRELMWLSAIGDWELRAGIGKVYWGVTESRHLVDVINQTDFVENADGEDKLGQPMINLNWFSDYGTIELFVLPMFRERSFAGEKGRPRGPLVIDTGQEAIYESSDGDSHVDVAVRWSHYIGDWDIGLSHFSGTDRNPVFQPSGTVLLPVYNLIDQTGLSLQTILGDWLWKLEATSSQTQGDRYSEAVIGFEYTQVGVFESVMDLGMISEYLYDSRSEDSPQPFDNDLMLGLRWVFNDMQSSEILMGGIFDLNGSATSISLEASRRLGQSWKLSAEYRSYQDIDEQDPLYIFRNDDYLQLDLAYYF